MRNTWTTLSVLLVLAALILPVGVIVAQADTSATSTTKQDGDQSEADLWAAVTAAITAYRGDQSDENLQGIADAIEAFMASEPSNEQYVVNSIRLYGQVKTMQGDLEGLVKRYTEWAESATGLAKVMLTYETGMAQAKLGNQEEAEAAVEALRALAEESEGRVAQAATQLADQLHAELRFVPGAVAPDFTLTNLAGTEDLSLSSFQGKYVLIDFWASWCRPCHSIMAQHIGPMYSEYGNDTVEVLGVGVNWRNDTAEAQAAFANRMDYHWPKVFDAEGSVASEYGVRGVPTLVLVDPEGKIVIARDTSGVISRAKEILEETSQNDTEDSE